MSLLHLSLQRVRPRQTPRAPTNDDRVRSYRAAINQSPCSLSSRHSPTADLAGQAALSTDYRPEMADCRGW